MMSEALHFELKHFGIKVILVEAGAIMTDFAFNQKQFHSPAYHDLDIQMELRFEDYLKEDRGTPAGEIAGIIADAIENPDPCFRLPAGKDAAYMISRRTQLSDAEWDQSWLYSSLNW